MLLLSGGPPNYGPGALPVTHTVSGEGRAGAPPVHGSGEALREAALQLYRELALAVRCRLVAGPPPVISRLTAVLTLPADRLRV